MRCVKVLSMGDTEVGKSCIIKRLGEKRFVNKYLATVGVDYGVVKVNLGNQELRVNIFDLSGHPYFYEVRNEFYREVQAVILVFDVSNPTSFESLDGWLKELTDELGGTADVVGILCANKCDRKRSVPESFARIFAELHGFLYFETSALTGAGISEMFEVLFTNVVKILDGGERTTVLKSFCHYTKDQLRAIYRLKSARDNFQKLGLQHGASRDDINKAYRKLAVLLHPDKSAAPGSEEAFKILAATRAALLGNIRT